MFKQNSGDNNCVAVVSAMATATTPKDFADTFPNNKPPYSLDLAFVYLIKHNMTMSLPEVTYTKENIIVSQTDLSNIPAIIQVDRGASASKENPDHLIYWDGKQVYDPDPMKRNGLPLGHYKIKYAFIIKQE
jgi:hypothetical protein